MAGFIERSGLADKWRKEDEARLAKKAKSESLPVKPAVKTKDEEGVSLCPTVNKEA